MYLTRRLVLHKLQGSSEQVVINTLSGAIDLVDDSVAAVLKQTLGGGTQALDGLNPEYLKHLRERYYVFETPEEEAECFERLYQRMVQLWRKEPVRFVICPTFTCNMHCVYCFEGEITRGRMNLLEPEQLEEVFTAIERIRKRFYPSAPALLTLFGGEPLMRPTRPCIALVLQYARSRGLSVDVVTNGLEAGHFLDLLEAHRDQIHQIQITLDGPELVHDHRRMRRGGQGTFAAITANVNRLIECGLPVTIRINVDKGNIEALPMLIQYFEEQGWTLHPHFACYVYPVMDYTQPKPEGALREDELLFKLQRLFRREGRALPAFALHGFKVLGHVASVIDPKAVPIQMPPLFTFCEANGLRYFAFGPDGYIYPCGQCIGRPPFAIGVFEPEFNLWEDRCREWQERSVRTIPQCRVCPIATLCGGGCAYAAWMHTGSLLEPDCRRSYEILNAYLEHMSPFILSLRREPVASCDTAASETLPTERSEAR